jgi:hypothetical protein
MIDADLPCLTCGYNLRGLRSGGVCPECGLAVQRTLRGGLLKFSRPSHLRSVHNGAELVLLSFLFLGPAGVTLWLLSIISVPGSQAGGLRTNGFVVAVLAIAALLGPGSLLWGWWMITGPDAELQGIERRWSARRITRRLTLTVGALYLGLLLLIVFRHLVPDLLALVGWHRLSLVVTCPALAHLVTSLRCLQQLAARAEGEAVEVGATAIYLLGGATLFCFLAAVLGWPLLAIFALFALAGLGACLVLYVTSMARFEAVMRAVMKEQAGAATQRQPTREAEERS